MGNFRLKNYVLLVEIIYNFIYYHFTMEHTYIIQYAGNPVIIINFDYSKNGDIFVKEYEDYHGRIHSYLELTSNGLIKVENALGYKVKLSKIKIVEVTESLLEQNIEQIKNEIETLKGSKQIYESWLNNTNTTNYSLL